MGTIESPLFNKLVAQQVMGCRCANSIVVPVKGNIMAKAKTAASADVVWTNVNITSANGKALKAKLSALADEIKQVRGELETMAAPLAGKIPAGKELVFSHRFGLAYAVVDKKEETAKARKVPTGPSI
jgi:hypothetical protein